MKTMQFHLDVVDCPTLVCPRCGGRNLHHGAVEVFERLEDADSGMHVVVDGSVVIDNSMKGNPSSRRHGLRIGFTCECCSEPSSGGDMFLEIAQHKGETHVGWGKIHQSAVSG